MPRFKQTNKPRSPRTHILYECAGNTGGMQRGECMCQRNNALSFKGTAHCANMYPPSRHDPPGLTKACAPPSRLPSPNGLLEALRLQAHLRRTHRRSPPTCFPKGCVLDGIKKKYAKKACCSGDGTKDKEWLISGIRLAYGVRERSFVSARMLTT